MLAARVFLSIVGLLYLLLAAWCVVLPADTSAAVGLERVGGSGASEFLVVFGGLQTALGAVFLLPLCRAEQTRVVLLACLIIHGTLAAFRSVSFVVFAGFGTTTYVTAMSEWALFLAAAGFFWSFHRAVPAHQKGDGDQPSP